MLGLMSRTDPAWVAVALGDELALLRDHAHLERKAAGHVITLMGQVPHAAERLLAVVYEELEHHERVCALIRARGAELGADPGNPYVRAVGRLGGRTPLDRLLRMGLIEARSYEKFSLLAEHAPPGDLRDLFSSLKDSEAGHHALFIRLAHERWPHDEVRERWTTLARAESDLLKSLPPGPRVH